MGWQVFDRIRSFARSMDLYQQERLYQDQSSLDRLLTQGGFVDFSQQRALLDQTNLQINRLERYKDYDQMDETGEISLALDLYADESSLIDPERKHTIIIKAATRKVKRELEDLFYSQLLIDAELRPMVRYLCKYGDAPFEIIPSVNRDGVAAVRFMNVYNFTRIETRFGDLVGFFHQDEAMQEPKFLHPWQVMHLRLTDFHNLYHPYGRSILESGRKAFKQLRLMEDAALVYRITRAPEKRIFKIPIGNIAPKEVPEFMQGVARMYKQQRFYDPNTGQFNERFSPLIQEDDFFIPVRPDGTSPDITTLPGAENLDQIKDIEYFKKKMIAPTKIPFARVGIGENAGQDNNRSLASSHAEFSKSVQWVQRVASIGLTKVAICHLAMAGYAEEDLKGFEISLSATNAIDELYRMETWSGRAGVMADLKDLGWFPGEWIVTRFTDLSPDEIQEMKDMRSDLDEMEGGMGGMGGGFGGMPGDIPGGDMPGGDELPELEGTPDAEMPGSEEGDLAGDTPVPEFIQKKCDQIIMEIKNEDAAASKARVNRNILEAMYRRRSNITGVFDYMKANNELADLQSSKSGGEPKILVESLVNNNDIESVCKEYRLLLCDSGYGVGDDDLIISDSDVPDDQVVIG